jgi:acetyl esterase/lipase
LPLVEKNVIYRGSDAATDDEYLRTWCTLDLYLPPAPTEGFPLIVWFHGGGLVGGDRQADSRLAPRLEEHGIAFANADYRVNPQVKYPAYLEDAAQAVAWSVCEGIRRGANPGAIFVGGHSAGGYLAAMLAMDTHFLTDAGLAPEAIAGFIAVSGQMVTHFTIREERGFRREAVIADDAAPLYYVRQEAPPLLLLVGDADMAARVEENQLFAASMTGVAGNKTTHLLVVPDRDHGTVCEKLLLPGDPGGQELLSFLQKYTKNSS